MEIYIATTPWECRNKESCFPKVFHQRRAERKANPCFLCTVSSRHTGHCEDITADLKMRSRQERTDSNIKLYRGVGQN